MEALALDSSVVLTWVLQERGWQAVDTILSSGKFRLLMPGPVLTEVIYRARSKGNASSPEHLATSLETQGLAVEAAERQDLIVAASLYEMSQRNPRRMAVGNKAETLSLADSLVLAISQRLGCRAVSRDSYWKWLSEEGLINVTIVEF